MADSSQYNLSLVITANNKAVEEINKLWKSVDNVKWNILQLSKSTKKTLKTVWVAATAVAWSMVALWKSFVDSAMEAEPLQRSFERLSKSAWVASDDMLNAMRKASKWTVSDLKLMEAANTAYSLWVVKTTDEMSTLMQIARVKWQAMWRSMEEALDDIVRWLWRSSPMILDNLWIVIKQWEAQEEYAKQLWKTVNELTEAEKKQALVNAVVKQWKQELLEAWDLQLTMAERLQIVNAQRDNMKRTVWEALLPVVQRVLEAITPIIQKVADWINENPKLTANILMTVAAISSLIAVVSWLALALPTISTAIWVLTWPVWRLIAWITAVALAWKNNRWWIRDIIADAINTISEILKPRLDKLQARREEHGETVMIYVQEIMWAIAETIWKTLWYLATFIAASFEWIEKTIRMFVAIWNGDREEVSNIAVERAVNMDNLLTNAFWETRTNIKNWLNQFIDDVINKFNELKNNVKSIVDSIKNTWNSTKDTVSWAAKKARDYVSSPFKAWWWAVYSWTPYIVWEKWPELFIPSQRWTITPSNQITNNNWIEINMNWTVVRNDNDITLIAQEIIRQIRLEKNFWIA